MGPKNQKVKKAAQPEPKYVGVDASTGLAIWAKEVPKVTLKAQVKPEKTQVANSVALRRSESWGNMYLSEGQKPINEIELKAEELKKEPRLVGTVRFFDWTKGFGFVRPDADGYDCFLHVSALEKAGIHDLKSGDRLEYDEKIDKRGKVVAANIWFLETREEVIARIRANQPKKAKMEKKPSPQLPTPEVQTIYSHIDPKSGKVVWKEQKPKTAIKPEV